MNALSRLFILTHPRSEQRDNVSSVSSATWPSSTDRLDRYDDLCRAACSDALPAKSCEFIVIIVVSLDSFRNQSRGTCFRFRASIVASWRPIIAASKHRANYLRADHVVFSGRWRSRYRDCDRPATLPSNSKLVERESTF